MTRPGGSWEETAPGDDGAADVRRAVRELVRTRPEVSEDHERLDGYLRDFCPNRPGEVAVIVVAARAGVPGELAGASHGHAVEAMSARLTTRLHTEAGVDRALAQWAVETWALALGVVDREPPLRVEAPPVAPLDDALRAMAAPLERQTPREDQPVEGAVILPPPAAAEQPTDEPPPEPTPRTVRRPPGPPSGAAPPLTPTAPYWRRNRLIVAGGTVAASLLLVAAVAVLPTGTDTRKTETVGPSATSPVSPEVTSAPATTEPATPPPPTSVTTSPSTGNARPTPAPQTRPTSAAPTSSPTAAPRTTATPTSATPNPGTPPPAVPAPQPGQLVIAPRSGPPGTTIKLSAGACSRPALWTGGEIYFGLNNPSAAGTAGEDPVTGQRWWVSSTTGWQDQLVVPAGLVPGRYTVWANCYAHDPSSNSWKMFYLYPVLDFAVT